MKASPGSRFIHALQIGGLLGLGVFLWGMSLLPIQRAVLVWDCNVLVSPTEHAKLSELARPSKLESPIIDWLVCEPMSSTESVPSHSEQGEVAVRRVRLRIGMNHRASEPELARVLSGLAESTSQASRPTAELQREVCQARWRLQVAEHALSRFRLDCARDGIELPVLNQTVNDNERSPFRLASQSSLPVNSDVKLMFESLRSEIDAARHGLELADRGTVPGDNATRSVFTLNGAPRFVVRGGSLHRVRTSVLVLTVLGVVGLVAMPRKRNRSRKKPDPIACTREDLMRMLDGLRLPYLGVLPSESDDGEVALPLIQDSPQPSRSGSWSRFPRSGRYALSFWARWSDRVLVMWIGCFLLRYVLDPIWRELLFQAPLAAFSSVVFGV